MPLHNPETCQRLAQTIGWELPHETIVVQWELFMAEKLTDNPEFFSKQLSIYKEEYHRDWELEHELHNTGVSRDMGR